MGPGDRRANEEIVELPHRTGLDSEHIGARIEHPAVVVTRSVIESEIIAVAEIAAAIDAAIAIASRAVSLGAFLRRDILDLARDRPAAVDLIVGGDFR